MFYKIEVNRDTLGRLKMQFNYIYSRLGRAAQNMVILFTTKALWIGQYNLNSLLNYLKECYTDPDVSQKALDCFRRIRQGDNEPFAAFLSWFEQELIESNGAAWPDYFKILYLEGALNAKIAGYLITMNPDRQNYLNFIRVIQ